MTRHLFTCLFAIHIFLWFGVSFKYFAHLKRKLKCFLIEAWDFLIYSGYKPFIRYIVAYLWLAFFIVFIGRHLLHTWPPYFVANISYTTDIMLSQDYTPGKHSAEFSIKFIQDAGEERWTRKGLFRTCSLKPVSMPTDKAWYCCFYF